MRTLRRALPCRIAVLGTLAGLATGLGLALVVLRPPPAGLGASAAAASRPEETGGNTAADPAPAVQVLIRRPGLSADVMEQTVTNRLERWVNQAPGVRHVTSHTIADVSIVRVYFDSSSDPAVALAQVNSLALAALPLLPPGALPPLVLPLAPGNTGPLGLLAVEAPSLDGASLKDVARMVVRDQLARIDGCVAPLVLGGKDREIVVYLDRKKLEARKLSPAAVVSALRKANTTVGLGSAYFGDNHIRLEAGPAARTLAGLYDLPVGDKPGDAISLRDVSHIEDAFPVPTARVRIDGRRGIVLPVHRRAGVAPGTVQERLAKALPGMERALSSKVRLRWVPFGGKAAAEDTGLVTVLLRVPSHLRLDAAEKRVAAVEEFLRANVPAAERTAIVSELGVGPGLGAAYTRNDGEQDAVIYLRLADGPRRTARQYVEKLRRDFHKEAKFADLRVRFEADGRGAPLAVVVRGGEPEEGARLAAAIRRRVAAVRGATDVTVVERRDAPALVFEVDRRKAAAAGLSARDLLWQAAAAAGGPIRLDDLTWLLPGPGPRFPITIQYPEDPFLSLDDVLSVPALGANAPVRLSSLVKIRRSWTAVEIDHADLQRVFRVTANVEGREARDVAAEVRKALKELPAAEPVKVEVEVQGPREAP